jgi:S1-C subfamily serine protease
VGAVGQLKFLELCRATELVRVDGYVGRARSTTSPSALDGPLVDLNGKVIGITIGSSGNGLNITRYAIPINTALAVATQIADGNSQQ